MWTLEPLTGEQIAEFKHRIARAKRELAQTKQINEGNGTDMKLTDYITVVPPMKHFRQFWTAKLGEIEATGSDREEATSTLFIDIKTILSGDYIPVMIFHLGYVALVWRELAGWSYTIRRCGESGPVMSNIHCIGAKEPT